MVTSFVSDLSSADTSSLYPSCGKVHPEGLQLLDKMEFKPGASYYLFFCFFLWRDLKGAVPLWTLLLRHQTEGAGDPQRGLNLLKSLMIIRVKMGLRSDQTSSTKGSGASGLNCAKFAWLEQFSISNHKNKFQKISDEAHLQRQQMSLNTSRNPTSV